MFPGINPVTTPVWQTLWQHHLHVKNEHLRIFFQNDPNRFEKFSLRTGDILFDYSKNLISDETVQLLLQLAEECKVKDAIEAMFNGEKINQTENRSVLHVALRNFSKQPMYSDGKDVMPEVKKVLRKMKALPRPCITGSIAVTPASV